MAENKYRKEETPKKESAWSAFFKKMRPVKTQKEPAQPTGKARLRRFRFSFGADTGPISLVPKFLFVALLGVLYIANSHYTEKVVRVSHNLNREVEQLRVDYTTLKYEYIKVSQQAELGQKAAKIGLSPNDKPIVKIVLD